MARERKLIWQKRKKTSEAQIRATREWEKRNPEAKRYSRTKTNARTFARHYAKSYEDIKELTDQMLEIFHNENPNATGGK